MKIIRTSKISLKFTTSKKRNELNMLLDEYQRVVNFFISEFKDEIPKKTELLKPIVDRPLTELENGTWLSSALRQIAARTAIDMLKGMHRKGSKQSNRAKKKALAKVGIPVHGGKSIILTSMCAKLQKTKNAEEFEYWLHLANLGNHLILDIPLKSHRHLKQIQALGTLNKSITLKRDYIIVSVEYETGPKREDGISLGLDSGFARDGALAVLDDGSMFGKDISKIIDLINRKKQGSKNQKTARRHLKHYMDKVAKEIVATNPRMLVVENLKGLKYKSKIKNKNKTVKRRLTKTMWRRIGSWTYRYWLGRLQMNCELNRVQFRSVPPYNTSTTCPDCSHINPKNRASRDLFLCLECGYTEHADLVGARNILARGLEGEIYWAAQAAQKIARHPSAKLDLALHALDI